MDHKFSLFPTTKRLPIQAPAPYIPSELIYNRSSKEIMMINLTHMSNLIEKNQISELGYFCIYELRKIDHNEQNMAWVFTNESIYFLKKINEVGKNYITLLGKILKLMDLIYPNIDLQLGTESILIDKANYDLNKNIVNKILENNQEIFDLVKKIFIKAILNGCQNILSVANFCDLCAKISQICNLYPKIKNQIIQKLIPKIQLKIKDPQQISFVVSMMEKIVRNNSFDMPKLIFENINNVIELQELINGINSISDKYFDIKIQLLKRVNLKPHNLEVFVEMFNSISNFDYILKMSLINQLTSPIIKSAEEFMKLAKFISRINGKVNYIKEKLFKKICFENISWADIINISNIISAFVESEKIKIILMRRMIINLISPEIINSGNKVSVSMILGFILSYLEHVEFLYINGDTLKSGLEVFIDNTDIIRPSRNIKHKLDLWLEHKYSAPYASNVYNWFEDNRMQRGNPYGMYN
ncbi:MAG: hypothetical protein ACK5Z5_06755, partial [Neisseriaceae bacterium]